MCEGFRFSLILSISFFRFRLRLNESMSEWLLGLNFLFLLFGDKLDFLLVTGLLVDFLVCRGLTVT